MSALRGRLKETDHQFKSRQTTREPTLKRLGKENTHVRTSNNIESDAAQEKSPEAVKGQIPEMASPESESSDYTTLEDLQEFSDWVKENVHTLTKPMDAPYVVSPEVNEKISIYLGDITKLQIDAIVNAANKTLLGGGGVDGAIHRGAGPQLLEKCRELNGCKTGDVKITRGFNLPARAVIHTVGPMSKKPQQLSNCYYNSLNLAVHFKLRSIAFPCISTGIYGFPHSEASDVVLETVRQWLEDNENFKKVDRIIFCLFNREAESAYYDSILRYFPVEQLVDSPGSSPITGDSIREEEVEGLTPDGIEHVTDQLNYDSEVANESQSEEIAGMLPIPQIKTIFSQREQDRDAFDAAVHRVKSGFEPPPLSDNSELQYVIDSCIKFTLDLALRNKFTFYMHSQYKYYAKFAYDVEKEPACKKAFLSWYNRGTINEASSDPRAKKFKKKKKSSTASTANDSEPFHNRFISALRKTPSEKNGKGVSVQLKNGYGYIVFYDLAPPEEEWPDDVLAFRKWLSVK